MQPFKKHLNYSRLLATSLNRMILYLLFPVIVIISEHLQPLHVCITYFNILFNMGKLLHLYKTLQIPIMCTASCNKKGNRDILISC